MPDTQIIELIQLSQKNLRSIQIPLADFLNHYAIPQLVLDKDENKIENTIHLLSDLRHLLVSCENTLAKLGIISRSNHFNKDFAEHTLYETVHLCVNKFYYPEHELYEEDGRNSYTGKDAIKFSFPVHPSIKELIIFLSKQFEVLREELSYYETDYVTKMRFEGKML